MVSWPTRRGQQHPMASLFNLQDGVQRRVTADWVGWVQKSNWNNSTVVVVSMKRMKFMEMFMFLFVKVHEVHQKTSWGMFGIFWRLFIIMKHFLVSSNFVGSTQCFKRKHSQKNRLESLTASGPLGRCESFRWSVATGWWRRWLTPNGGLIRCFFLQVSVIQGFGIIYFNFAQNLGGGHDMKWMSGHEME